MNSRKNAENALNAPYNFSTHRRAYNKEEEEENDNDETPTLPKNSRQTVILYNRCLLSPKQTGLKS